MNTNKIFTNIFNVLLHVFILFLILTIIFWLVIKNAEENSINNEISKNIEDVFSKIRNNLSNEKKLELSEIVKNSKSELEVLHRFYSDPYETRIVNNDWLYQNNILCIIVIFVAILVLVLSVKYYSKKGSSFSIWPVIRENIILFTLIGGMEIWFFLEIGMKFIPTKPSMIMSSTINALKDNF